MEKMSVIVTVTMFYIVTATEERMSDNVLIIISYLRRGRESRDEEGGRLGPLGSTGLGGESFNFLNLHIHIHKVDI